MSNYKISIEYVCDDGTDKTRSKLEPLIIEATSFAEALTSGQVAEAIKRLNSQIVGKQIESLPPEVALEAASSLASLYSVHICGELYEDVG